MDDLKCYCLCSIDLSGVGGPMGTDTTIVRWRKYFKSHKLALGFATKDSGKRILTWTSLGPGESVSEDLGHTQYSIHRIQINGG
jgi:hypothetical protein